MLDSGIKLVHCCAKAASRFLKDRYDLNYRKCRLASRNLYFIYISNSDVNWLLTKSGSCIWMDLDLIELNVLCYD